MREGDVNIRMYTSTISVYFTTLYTVKFIAIMKRNCDTKSHRFSTMFQEFYIYFIFIKNVGIQYENNNNALFSKIIKNYLAHV